MQHGPLKLYPFLILNASLQEQRQANTLTSADSMSQTLVVLSRSLTSESKIMTNPPLSLSSEQFLLQQRTEGKVTPLLLQLPLQLTCLKSTSFNTFPNV